MASPSQSILPILQSLAEVGEEVGVFAGEDGEGGEEVGKVVGVEAVGFGDGMQ
jgi:hypothetical protein